MEKLALYIQTLDVDNLIIHRENTLNSITEANYESEDDIGYKENIALVNFLQAVIDIKLSEM